MSLINLIIVLIVVGLLLYAANNWLPIDGKIKTILNVVVILVVLLWLLSALVPGLAGLKVG